VDLAVAAAAPHEHPGGVYPEWGYRHPESHVVEKCEAYQVSASVPLALGSAQGYLNLFFSGWSSTQCRLPLQFTTRYRICVVIQPTYAARVVIGPKYSEYSLQCGGPSAKSPCAGSHPTQYSNRLLQSGGPSAKSLCAGSHLTQYSNRSLQSGGPSAKSPCAGSHLTQYPTNSLQFGGLGAKHNPMASCKCCILKRRLTCLTPSQQHHAATGRLGGCYCPVTFFALLY
jgi:hypothetical protein